MDKKYAIKILGGKPAIVAKAIGISVQAISAWPDVLPRTISDRVEAAYHRKHGAALPVNTEGVFHV